MSLRHSSLQQTQAAEEIKRIISIKETAVNDAITATNDQSAEVGALLEALTLAEPDEGETEADQMSATKQVAMEKKALGESRMLFEELLSVIQVAAANARAGQGITVTFGSNNSGQQVGVNSGTISATFGGMG
jgi:SesB domain on fungal death-pathway protein